MKKIYTAAVSTVIIVLLFLGAFTVVCGTNGFSENENRALKTRNDISRDLFGGELQKDFETMLQDQFPLRDGASRFQSELKYLLGKRDINGAYIGHDRYIQKITDSDVRLRTIRNHASLYARAEDEGLRVTAMPVPSAGIVLKDELPKNAGMYDYTSVLETISDVLKEENVINLSERKKFCDGNCFFKTDHHWTAFGAYEAYCAFTIHRGKEPKPIDAFDLETVSTDFLGSLYSKVLLDRVGHDSILAPKIPDGIEVAADGNPVDFYCEEALKGKDKYLFYQNGNHGITEIISPEAESDETLLIIKDSFANSLVPFLVRDFKRIVMIDERFVAADVAALAKEYSADEALIVKEAYAF